MILFTITQFQKKKKNLRRNKDYYKIQVVSEMKPPLLFIKKKTNFVISNYFVFETIQFLFFLCFTALKMNESNRDLNAALCGN